MFIEWMGNPDCIRRIDTMFVEEVSGVDDFAIVYVVASGDVKSCCLYEGTVKSARRVYNAIRKRLGAGDVFITCKWIKKEAAR